MLGCRHGNNSEVEVNKKLFTEAFEPNSEYLAFDGEEFWQRRGEAACTSCFEGDACAVQLLWLTNAPG